MAIRSKGGENILAMAVGDIGFLLDRLGQDCHPLQFLRELAQNSIEAIDRQGESGDIVWDVDWNQYDLTGSMKLCVIDTGDGMTGDEMVRFINQLSSSVAQQSLDGNYGVGAKIAAATRNHEGVVYLSWKNGEGAMIHLYRDPDTRQYGLRQWERQDGSWGHFLPVEDSVKPDLIGDHGTMVVLLGNEEAESTIRPPDGAASPSRWFSKYLNSRYFRFPESVTMKAREGWDFPRTDPDRNILRTITGQEPYLDKHAIASGHAPLSGATAHWWILKDEPALRNNSGFIESSGHVAALYRNELYEMATARAGMSRLQSFGVTFGYGQVVIYIEPTQQEGRNLTTNTARTMLLVNNESLPWSDWAAEFREDLPDEIRKLVEQKAAGAQSRDHADTVRERLKDLLDLFKVSRYRPVLGGSVLIDDQELVRGGRPRAKEDSAPRKGGGRPGGQGGKSGNVYAIFEKKDGTPGSKVKADIFPNWKWVSIEDGTREYGDIEDRAAKFHRDQNLLLINADFRAFKDLINFFVKEFGDQPGVRELADDAVHAWVEQALVEAVIGLQALEQSKHWSHDDVQRALSEEGLTTAVMQRYHIHFAVKRELGSKLGSQRRAAG